MMSETTSEPKMSGESGADASAAVNPSAQSELRLNLSTLDKIKRFFFSKEEWEAYLLEKLEEEQMKKDGDSTPVKLKDDQNSDHKSVLSWIRTVFPSQDEANTFLKSQLENLQRERETTTTTTRTAKSGIL